MLCYGHGRSPVLMGLKPKSTKRTEHQQVNRISPCLVGLGVSCLACIHAPRYYQHGRGIPMSDALCPDLYSMLECDNKSQGGMIYTFPFV